MSNNTDWPHQAVGIQFSTTLSALGTTALEIQQALSGVENTLSERSDLIADQTVWVGASKQVLSTEVPNGLSQADSRNLRFALTALMQIEPQIKAYTAKFDIQRLAIILGTSTSGIADNAGLRHHDGVLLPG